MLKIPQSYHTSVRRFLLVTIPLLSHTLFNTLNAQITLKNSDLYIQEGANMSVSGLQADTSRLHGKGVIINHGDWIADTDEQLMTTDSVSVYFSQGSIGGSRPTSFYTVFIDAPSGVIDVAQNMHIRKKLDINNGVLDIHAHNVFLDQNVNILENSDGYAFDLHQSGGSVVATTNGNNLANANIGGLGLVVSYPGNVGDISIVRTHVPVVDQGAFVVYDMYVDQLPTAPVDVDIQHLFPHIVQGLSQDAIIYQSNDGGISFVPADGVITNLHTIFTLGPDTDTTDIADLMTLHTISLFPNPTSGPITIDFPSHLMHSVNVQVFDMTGSLVHRDVLAAGQQSYAIDVTGLSSGSYVVYIDNRAFKIMVQ